MQTLSTRLLAGTPVLTLALALALPALPPAVQAAAPQLKTQAPGWYRMMLGRFEVTVLNDGTHPFPVESVMIDVTPGQVADALKLDELRLPIQGSINAFLINTGDRLVLVDSGAGELYGACCGKLLANLRAAGYAPEQVDEVLLTHLHKDHVGGIVHAGKAVFPNAVVRAARVDADYWLDPNGAAKAPALLASFFDSARTALAPYQAAGRFKPFEGAAELESGIRAVPEPGHTPGHTGYLVESGGQRLLLWGDTVHVAPVQLRHPRASVKYDNSDTQAWRTRETLFQRAAGEHLWIGAAHLAFPGLGHLRRAGDDYDWIPINYEADPAADSGNNPHHP
jgi:glyoxylase-like metal-dependent hydrolase (beta-lactamase superfamily II)